MVAGFRREKKGKGSSGRKQRDFSKAVSMNALITEEFDYGDISESELDLPIGLFLPRSKDLDSTESELEEEGTTLGDYDRLISFKFIDNIDDTQYELTLEKAEQTAKRDFSKHCQKLAVYLAKTVSHIGDIPLPDIAKRLGCSKEDIFMRMWVADIVTLVLAARYAINKDRLYKLNIECGCDRKTTIESDPENGVPLQSLDEIQITNYNNAEYPLFLVELPEGFNDGKGHVSKLYFEPQKLYQMTKMTQRTQDSTDRTNIISQMCVGMPESEVYGQKKGKVLTQDVMINFSYGDRRVVDAAVTKINFGPDPMLKVQCPNCIEGNTVPHYVNWLVQTTNVLYGTGSNTLIKF